MIGLNLTALSPPDAPAPELELRHLDTLWLQVTGTLCNLACRHCFISCGPKNDSHPFMELDEVRRAVESAATMGVKEFYFTGGEPFMHPQIREMIELTLEHGPLSVRTNGVLMDEELAAWLADVFESSRYNFDVGVSLDGAAAEENDAIRVRHIFEKILGGAVRLHRAGLNPVFTVTTCHAELAESAGRQRFFDLLAQRRITRPRLKFLAPFKIGREERRGGAYEEFERLSEEMLDEEARASLQCSSCRMVTAKGVYPCPILIEEEGARMGDTLEDGMKPIKLDHPACYTCFVEGVTCRT